jgi:N-methylhydantoinase A
VEFVNFRVRASLPVRPLRLPRLAGRGGRVENAVKGERPAFSGMACDFIPFTVYDRYRLFPGAAFSGPAIVEERESTVIIGEDARAEVDEFGFLWIDLRQAAVPPASTENVGREVHELPERAANA